MDNQWTPEHLLVGIIDMERLQQAIEFLRTIEIMATPQTAPKKTRKTTTKTAPTEPKVKRPRKGSIARKEQETTLYYLRKLETEVQEPVTLERITEAIPTVPPALLRQRLEALAEQGEIERTGTGQIIQYRARR